MKGKFNLIVGLLALSNAVYHLVTCPLCEERLFGFDISGMLYLGFWIAIMIMMFYSVYDVNRKVKKA